MTRQQCEAKLIDLMQQAMEAYQEYNPCGNHLSMFCFNGQINVMDFMYDAEGNSTDAHTIDVAKFEDGTIWSDKEAVAV